MSTEKPTRTECLLAQCWECLGNYIDGRTDCRNTRCPSYTYMPYRTLEPNLWWREYSPKRRGLVKKEDAKPNWTPEQRARNAERLRSYHAKRNLQSGA
jgi:hypothetical protein